VQNAERFKRRMLEQVPLILEQQSGITWNRRTCRFFFRERVREPKRRRWYWILLSNGHTPCGAKAGRSACCLILLAVSYGVQRRNRGILVVFDSRS
jgi:hypothetical protein